MQTYTPYGNAAVFTSIIVTNICQKLALPADDRSRTLCCSKICSFHANFSSNFVTWYPDFGQASILVTAYFLHTIPLVHMLFSCRAFESSKMYREVKVRGALLDGKTLKLLPLEQLYEKVVEKHVCPCLYIVQATWWCVLPAGQWCDELVQRSWHSGDHVYQQCARGLACQYKQHVQFLHALSPNGRYILPVFNF